MRILPLTMILAVLSLSFCAQKEAPTPAPVVVTPTTPTNPTTPTTPTDTAKS